MALTKDFPYLSVRRSVALTGTRESRTGKILVVVFKKHKYFNFRKTDFLEVVYYLPLKSFFSPGTAYGILGGKKEGVFSKVWWELQHNKADVTVLLRKYNTPTFFLSRRIRNKTFTKILNELYHAKSLGLKYKSV